MIHPNCKDYVKRFWNNVDQAGDCWKWKACKDPNGYGQMSMLGKNIRSHRLSWIIHYGPIPKGLFVCHRCDNPECTNPKHLFLGNNLDNMKDAYKKGRLKNLTGPSNPLWIKRKWRPVKIRVTE